MRIYLILGTLGLLTMCFGALLLFPILIAIAYQEWHSIPPFMIASAIAITLGYSAKQLTPKRAELHRNEGLAVVAFTWLLAAILGSIPFLFYNLGMIDALFESTSGITTTGATIFKDFSLYPKTIFFWRSFSQWLGGLGILVLFIAILPQFAVAGRQLFFAEAPGPTEDKLTPRIRHTAMYLWALYLALTFIEFILLRLCGMPTFDAICNSFSTVAAGGFSPNPESIMGYHSSTIEWIIVIFIFLAGTNFALQFRAIKTRNFKLFLKNSEFLTYTLIYISATVLLSLILYIKNHSASFEVLDAIRISAFQCISIMTATGFASTDYNTWSDSAKMILLLLMFVGGCAGSNAGSIKVARVLLLVKHAINELILLVHPKAVLTLKLDKTIVPPEVMKQISSFFILYILLLILSTTIIGIIESDIIVGYISSIATLSNIGPGLGPLGPMGNYADLSPITKIILVFNMWVGRLEIVTVLVLLCPHIWRYASRK